MVYRTIIDVILHLFIICNDLWCQLPFFSQTFRHNGSAVFGTMPPMCRSCPDVNKLPRDGYYDRQHRPFMLIKSFVQHSGWQEMVSLCSLIRLIGVCADHDQPEFLCSRSDSRYVEVHVATAGGWLTRYRPREVRNSIYRYRKIHIDYRSKFLYRFISPISIIYGNTSYYGIVPDRKENLSVSNNAGVSCGTSVANNQLMAFFVSCCVVYLVRPGANFPRRQMLVHRIKRSC